MGDALCNRFAPPEWRQWDERWHRREVDLASAQREMWRMVHTTPDAFNAAIDELGVLRPGLTDLLDAAEAADIPVVIASGGFEYYIRRLLAAHLHRFAAIYANEMRLVDGGIEVNFPHVGHVSCAADAVCKGAVIDAYEGPVIFCGDGSSDRCALGKADTLFVVEGSRLEARAREEGVACTPFSDFRSVIFALRQAEEAV